MAQDKGHKRAHIVIRGAVQGVGFRPFIYRLAGELGLKGWVVNSQLGVSIEAEGREDILENFLLRIGREKPPRSSIQSLECSLLDPLGYGTFEIRESDHEGPPTAIVMPDIATCPDCRREILDPGDRRYLYPFTNCTNCGPRYTIIESLPYDRPRTTMKNFTMCPHCAKEYHDPSDRRFHAQPNACPDCGPHLELWDPAGKVLSAGHRALLEAAERIRSGGTVAVKGLGGFHIMVSAWDEDAVGRLREHKHREEKPFALMFPSLESVGESCEVSPLEERLLLSPESPIVLLKRKPGAPGTGQGERSICPSVAPDNPTLGAMLPYTPLHLILMKELNIPVVATSGNLSDEPIATDERDALIRLKGIGDAFLVHDRPIKRHVDDSIVRVMLGREIVLRRARGYTPLPVQCTIASGGSRRSILSVGAHLKNTVALGLGDDVFISQHIGDLETEEAYRAFTDAIGSLTSLYDTTPGLVVADMHPGYLSTQYARGQKAPVEQVQHHYAHIASCMAENQIDGRVLGVSWDGTGYGPDGSIWGGEFLLVDESSFTRSATFRAFRLPGGDRAIREPRRAAIGVLYGMSGEKLLADASLPTVRACTPAELSAFPLMLLRGINSPLTTSAGRLFDAVSSLTGLCQRSTFEGQGAMRLEFATAGIEDERMYHYEIVTGPSPGGPSTVDWVPLIGEILQEVRRGTPAGVISARFHNTLSGIIVDVAHRVGEEKVVLSGGCFQNRYLTERTVGRLRKEGFRPYWHQRVPPNDGGIALGQIYAVLRRARGKVG